MALRVVREGEAPQPQSEEVLAHYGVAARSLEGMRDSLGRQFGYGFFELVQPNNVPAPATPAEAAYAQANERVQAQPNNVIQFPVAAEPALGNFAVNESGVESDVASPNAGIQPLGNVVPIGEFPGIEPPQMAA